MPIRNIIIKSASEGVSRKPYSVVQSGNSLMIDSVLYKKLSSIIENSIMEYSVSPDSLYREFVNDMDELSRLKINSNLSAEDEAILIEVDNYFSELGLTETYKIKKDISGLNKSLNIIFRNRGE